MIDTGPNLSSVALYARYSSPKQSPKSIPDQLRDCRRLIASLGGRVIAEYSDAERTGKTAASRSGLQKLLSQCRGGKYTAICAESLDRISRNRTHMSQVYDELEYLGIPILTLQDGPVDDVHVGLKSTMNAMFLKDLASKTRRGLVGVIESGRQNSSPAYGYRLANLMEGSRVIRGLRDIDPDTSPIVRRIYDLYVNGASARAIAKLLNEENIPTPRNGRGWTHRNLTGMSKNHGILSNPLYRGEVVYGVSRQTINPTTGRMVHRIVPRDRWIIIQAPHLRIIDDDTWDAAQQRLHERSRPRTRFMNVPALARGAMPLTPLLRCSRCKGPVRTIARNRWACKNAEQCGKCSARTFVLRDIDRLAAQQLTGWIQRRRKWDAILQQAQNRLVQARLHLEAELSDRLLRSKRLIAFVERGSETPEVQDRIAELGEEIQDIRDQLAVHATQPQIRRATDDLRPALLTHAREVQSAVESDESDIRLPGTVELAKLLSHIDMSPGPGPGKAWLSIQPNIMNLVHSATRTLAKT